MRINKINIIKCPVKFKDLNKGAAFSYNGKDYIKFIDKHNGCDYVLDLQEWESSDLPGDVRVLPYDNDLSKIELHEL